MGMSWAQNYPLQPARIIVGAAAGSSPDIFARLMGKWLSDRLGQQFIIENRPGAAGNIGTDVVVHSPGRVYDFACRCGQCYKRDALREAQL